MSLRNNIVSRAAHTGVTAIVQVERSPLSTLGQMKDDHSHSISVQIENTKLPFEKKSAISIFIRSILIIHLRVLQ